MEQANKDLTDVIFVPCSSDPESAQLYASAMMMMERVRSSRVKLISVITQGTDNEIIFRQFRAACEFAMQYGANVILWNPLVYIAEETFRLLQESSSEIALIPSVYVTGNGPSRKRSLRAYSVDSKTHKLRRLHSDDKQAAVCDYSVIKLSCISRFHNFVSQSCPWSESLEYLINAFMSHYELSAEVIKPYGMFLGKDESAK